MLGIPPFTRVKEEKKIKSRRRKQKTENRRERQRNEDTVNNYSSEQLHKCGGGKKEKYKYI